MGLFHLKIASITQHITDTAKLECATLFGNTGSDGVANRQAALGIRPQSQVATQHSSFQQYSRQFDSKTAPTYPTEVIVC
jgi:hypothetical protein